MRDRQGGGFLVLPVVFAGLVAGIAYVVQNWRISISVASFIAIILLIVVIVAIAPWRSGSTEDKEEEEDNTR